MRWYDEEEEGERGGKESERERESRVEDERRREDRIEGSRVEATEGWLGG